MSAVERWRDLVQTRLDEMEGLRPGSGHAGPEYWDRRAARQTTRVAIASPDHPLVRRILAVTDEDATVVDAGAGTGRLALALAPRVERIVAVDESRGVLDLLEGVAADRDLHNVTTIHARWEDTDITADVAICSYVLPKLAEVDRFVRRLDAAAGHVFVEMGALSGGWVLEPLWRHFHGAPRQPHPTYLDALDVLAELGIAATASVVELPVDQRFASLEAAVTHYLGALLLEDHEKMREELAGVLEAWLVRRGGLLAPPVRTRPSAILTWGSP